MEVVYDPTLMFTVVGTILGIGMIVYIIYILMQQ
jgi:preprotein translocase subunit Sss1